MRTYRGERTEFGCDVTVDGKTLPLRSDLSGFRTTTFGWGRSGGKQLSLALLSDLLGDDNQAIRLSDVFERKVVTQLPPDKWTMTEIDLAIALRSLCGIAPDVVDGGADGRPKVAEAGPVSAAAGVSQNTEPTESVASPAMQASPAAANIELNHQLVAIIAYYIWEAKGRSDGHAVQDWLEAEAVIRAG